MYLHPNFVSLEEQSISNMTFKCDKCEKVYKTKRGLTSHEATHSGELKAVRSSYRNFEDVCHLN